MSKNSVYRIERKNTKTGYLETIQYTGSLKNKPKGWRVVKYLGEKYNG